MSACSPLSVENWRQADRIAPSFQQMQRLFASARIPHKPEANTDFLQASRELLELTVDLDAGQSASVAEVLAMTHTDALLVLKDDHLVAEHYFNGMTADSHHLLNSVTKSFVGMLAGIAVAQGQLDPEHAVRHYLPEFVDSCWGEATVRQVLDMTVGALYDEEYEDPHCGFWQEAAVVGWRPSLDGESVPANLAEFARTMSGQDQSHGARFSYRTVCTNVLGMVLEQAMGRPLAELLATELWQPMGPRHDASIVVDGDGFPYVGAGFSMAARDLLKFGQLLLNDGQANGQEIVPAAWIQDTLNGDGQSKASFADSKYGPLMPGWHYRNQFWVPELDPEQPREILLGLGIHGQALFVDKTNRTVMVKLSSQPKAEMVELHMAGIAAMDAISKALAT